MEKCRNDIYKEWLGMFLFLFGRMVVSKAGHDKGKVYVIQKTDSEYIYLMDGIYRTFEKPKKKNIKHVQPIYYVDENLQTKIDNKQNIINEDIKHAIKIYYKKTSNCKV